MPPSIRKAHPVTYSFREGNPDIDGDGKSLLSIEENTGKVRVQDMEDLENLGFSFVEPILRVSDTSGLFFESPVRIDLSQWSYRMGRPRLSVKSFEIHENQPLGTLLGKIQVLGESGQVISQNPSFKLLRVEGDSDLLNRRSPGAALVLARDGSLFTGRVLDYEVKPSYVARILVTDSNGLFLEENLDIRVVDEFRPIVRTMEGVAGDPVFDPRLVIENYTHAGMGPEFRKVPRLPASMPYPRMENRSAIPSSLKCFPTANPSWLSLRSSRIPTGCPSRQEWRILPSSHPGSTVSSPSFLTTSPWIHPSLPLGWQNRTALRGLFSCAGPMTDGSRICSRLSIRGTCLGTPPLYSPSTGRRSPASSVHCLSCRPDHKGEGTVLVVRRYLSGIRSGYVYGFPQCMARARSIGSGSLPRRLFGEPETHL